MLRGLGGPQIQARWEEIGKKSRPAYLQALHCCPSVMPTGACAASDWATPRVGGGWPSCSHTSLVPSQSQGHNYGVPGFLPSPLRTGPSSVLLGSVCHCLGVGSVLSFKDIWGSQCPPGPHKAHWPLSVPTRAGSHFPPSTWGKHKRPKTAGPSMVTPGAMCSCVQLAGPPDNGLPHPLGPVV